METPDFARLRRQLTEIDPAIAETVQVTEESTRLMLQMWGLTEEEILAMVQTVHTLRKLPVQAIPRCF